MPAITLAEIARLVDGELIGDGALAIEGVKPLAQAGPHDLSFLANPRYASQLETSKAGAILVSSRDLPTRGARIVVADPYFSLVRVVREWFAAVPGPPAGVDATARIGERSQIASSAAIGAYAVIGRDVTIGANVIIHPHVVIGDGSSIGDATVLYPNVTLYHGTRVGRRCIVHSGAVIGADGFGFATHEGTHHKLPQIGTVTIGDDVEIGANTTVDRAALGETVIGDGTKIDNLVQVAHNVRIGRRALLVSQSGIAGSTTTGDDFVLGGQAGLGGHLTLGDGVQVAAQSAVMKDFAGPAKLGGSPARPLAEHLRTEAALRRLPALLRRLAATRGDSDSKG